MKVAIITDTHIGTRSDSKIFLDHQQIFFQTQFFPYLDEHGIDTVLHLGDVFDRRKYINFYTFKQAKDFFFDPLKEKNIKMHVILGNHDEFFVNTSEVNSVSLLLDAYDNINIYETEPVELTLGSLRILMCPWLTKTNTEAALKIIKNSTANILCGHFDIKGFELLRGVVSDHGFDAKTFAHFESVWSGHYHHQSQHGNIKYLGTPYEMTWADYDTRKGFHVLDTETRELTFIENPDSIFHKLTYDDLDLTMDELANLDVSKLANCYVKVLVKTRTNPYLYDIFLGKLNDAGAADIKTIEETSSGLSDIGLEELTEDIKDTKDILHTYIDQLETRLNKTKLKRVVDGLYHEAMKL